MIVLDAETKFLDTKILHSIPSQTWTPAFHITFIVLLSQETPLRWKEISTHAHARTHTHTHTHTTFNHDFQIWYKWPLLKENYIMWPYDGDIINARQLRVFRVGLSSYLKVAYFSISVKTLYGKYSTNVPAVVTCRPNLWIQPMLTRSWTKFSKSLLKHMILPWWPDQ